MPPGPIGDTWAPGSWEWWEEGSWGAGSGVVTVSAFTYVRGLIVRSSNATGIHLWSSTIRNLRIRSGADATDLQVRP